MGSSPRSVLVLCGYVNKLGVRGQSSKQQKSVLLQFWRLEVQNQGVRSVLLGLVGRTFLASFSFWWLLTFLRFWTHHSYLCVHLHVGLHITFFSVSLSNLLQLFS